MLFQQGSGNLGQAVREVGRAGSNNSARDNNSHSHDESPDGDDTGSPVFRNGVGSKQGGIKTKRNARQQDQNKQVAVFSSLWMLSPNQHCQMQRTILQCALATLTIHSGLWAQAATSAEPRCFSLQMDCLWLVHSAGEGVDVQSKLLNGWRGMCFVHSEEPAEPLWCCAGTAAVQRAAEAEVQ